MKKCNQCKVEKPLISFYTNGKCGHHPKCKDCAKANSRAKRAENPQKLRDYEKSLYQKKPSIKKASIKKYYAKNSAKKIAYEKVRYLQDADRIKARCKNYRRANIDRVYALNGMRRQSEKQAKPAWADLKEIAKLYEWSAFVSQETGIKHHVDHIIPLKGKMVCGLHVHTNMQVIPASQNLRKSASFHG